MKNIKVKYKFTKYQSIIDPEQIFYALSGKTNEDSPVVKEIDGDLYIEVTSDFETSNMFKMDNLKAVGETYRFY